MAINSTQHKFSKFNKYEEMYYVSRYVQEGGDHAAILKTILMNTAIALIEGSGMINYLINYWGLV